MSKETGLYEKKNFRFLIEDVESSRSVVYKTDICLDGYCSTVQGLLDWSEVDLGFTELLFIQIGLCVMCVFVLYSPVSLRCAIEDVESSTFVCFVDKDKGSFVYKTDKGKRGLTLEALPPRGGGSAGCPKKGQEESETGE